MQHTGLLLITAVFLNLWQYGLTKHSELTIIPMKRAAFMSNFAESSAHSVSSSQIATGGMGGLGMGMGGLGMGGLGMGGLGMGMGGMGMGGMGMGGMGGMLGMGHGMMFRSKPMGTTVVVPIQQRGLKLTGHGYGGAKVDPIEFNLLGIPTQVDVDARGDVNGRTYIGEDARGMSSRK